MAECTERDWQLITEMVRQALERIAAEGESNGTKE
jgi:hypothetical protein